MLQKLLPVRGMKTVLFLDRLLLSAVLFLRLYFYPWIVPVLEFLPWLLETVLQALWENWLEKLQFLVLMEKLLREVLPAFLPYLFLPSAVVATP